MTLTHIPASNSYPGLSTLKLHNGRTFKALGIYTEEEMREAVEIYFQGVVDIARDIAE